MFRPSQGHLQAFLRIKSAFDYLIHVGIPTTFTTGLSILCLTDTIAVLKVLYLYVKGHSYSEIVHTRLMNF